MSEGEESEVARGSGYELMAFTEKHVDILINRLQELKQRKMIQYSQLWESAGLGKSDSSLSRWVNRETGWDTIGRAGHEALVMYLIDKRLWYTNEWEDAASAIPDVLFHSVAHYLGMGHATKENIRKRVKGVFRVYHPSLALKGKFVVGAALLRVEKQLGCCKRQINIQIQPGRNGQDFVSIP